MKKINGLLMVALVLILALGLTACGKKGNPRPRDQKNVFTWKEASADMVGDCIVLSGELAGAYENVDSFMLELEPVDAEICLDCPFTPREYPTVKPHSVQQQNFSFQYCPNVPASAYRWRLIARNIYSALPHALSKTGLVRKPF